ncbi:MAG: redoxin domain-containing protein [Saprospiraceae bacterium]|nr:redoxin domain-containing protein [Saprospiraceae bacterium]
MAVNIGERATLFTLRAPDKSEVHLNQYQGKKIVLLFFPLAFSSVCTKELCMMRDEMADYNALSAEVLAISVDALYSLNMFREKYGYNFSLLSDFNKEVSRSYGALHEEFGLGMRGVSKRAVFVIDKGGIIRHKEILDIPSQMPDFDKVKTVLASTN